MADSLSPLLGLTLLQQNNTSDLNIWGDLFNAGVIAKVELAISGVTYITDTSGTRNLSEAERLNAILDVRATLTGDLTLVVATNVSKQWYIYNGCTLAGHLLKIKTTAGSAVTIPAGLQRCYCDGSNTMYVG